MKIIMIDSNSYSNLANYDKNLLDNINCEKKILIGNKKYALDKSEFSLKLIYDYSSKKGIFKILSYFFSSLKMLKIILEEKPDIVHFQWLKAPYLDYFFIVFLKIKKIKLVYTAHNFLPHNTNKKFFKIYKKLYKKFDKIIVHENNLKKRLFNEMNISKNRIEVIPHGILDINKKEGFIENKDYILNKKENIKIRYGIFGSLSEYKGVDLLIEAWNESELSKDKNCELIMCGKSNSYIKKILQNKNNSLNIKIKDEYLEEKELYYLMQSADVVILPYREISQSGVLLSVLSEKKIVIVSDKGGLTQPFEIADIGWIIKSVDKESIKNILEKSKNEFEDKKNKIELNDSWVKILNYYSWKEIGHETKKLYLGLI